MMTSGMAMMLKSLGVDAEAMQKTAGGMLATFQAIQGQLNRIEHNQSELFRVLVARGIIDGATAASDGGNFGHEND